MMRRVSALAITALFLGTAFLGSAAAKEVTVKGSVTAVEDDGKSMTVKGEAGETTFKVSSKRTKFKKGTEKAGRKDVAAGKTVTVLYDDENPAKEAISIEVSE